MSTVTIMQRSLVGVILEGPGKTTILVGSNFLTAVKPLASMIWLEIELELKY